MKAVKSLIVSIALFFFLQTQGQVLDIDSDLNRFIPFLQGVNQFSKNLVQEKVYLHFDNTSYYQGDNIWFKCYVTSTQNQLNGLSKTLYVELLNPGGEVIDKRILKIENGQCHGDFSLTHLPFYSGFYEVRAYTKYMLNFGDDVIFSRLLPVFDKPKAEGDFEEKKMLAYSQIEIHRDVTNNRTGSYPMKRESPERGRDVNIRFFPEGGNLIQGVTSRIAFEATDMTGNLIDVTGTVVDAGGREICTITTLHEGRGIFTYTPVNGNRQPVAVVTHEGKEYRFDLPVSLPQGVVMEVDNLSSSDSIGITLRKTGDTPSEMLGVVILNGGRPQRYYFARIADSEIDFRMDKTLLPSGVSQIVLFESHGEILCDRLIFINRSEQIEIRAQTGKPVYGPFELVDIEFAVVDREMNPVNATFSLSVRDGANEVAGNHNILTDLLLMSELKGYVRNPAYYFEEDDDTRRSALDLLLMVQGWRRYAWKQIAGVEPVDIRYRPEQGIETHGQIMNYPLFGKPVPKPDVDVSLLLLQRGEDEDSGGDAIESAVTDSLGRFAFVTDVQGRWNMILSASENGKQRDYQIRLDRLFSPEPKRYNYAELQVNIAENNTGKINTEETVEDIEEDDGSMLVAYTDSLAKLGIDERVHLLDDVTVTARRRTKEQDIFHNRSTSVAYYDIQDERDNLYDMGGYTGNNIQKILMNLSPNFIYLPQYDLLLYKHKNPLFIINYERSTDPLPSPPFESFASNAPISLFGGAASNLGVINMSSFAVTNEDIYNYKLIDPKAIKSIYISENYNVMGQYAQVEMSFSEVEKFYGCVVFIETYEDAADIYADDAKGVRKTWLEGYRMVREFYHPNYSAQPPAPDDYRRTLYWNPAVTSDGAGHASIRFYNNSRSNNFSISAETITSSGMIGVYKK